MPIKIVAPGAELTLPEYTVGRASNTCTYPGIAQCFAIAGWSQSGMPCTHVSPGATKDDLVDAFAALRDMGGDQVLFWYIVGPFTDHFAVTKAQWRSATAIKETFKKEFKNKNARHFILDATVERHSKVAVPGSTIPGSFSSIDVRAEHRGYESMIWFSYKEGRRSVTAWSRFTLEKFVLL